MLTGREHLLTQGEVFSDLVESKFPSFLEADINCLSNLKQKHLAGNAFDIEVAGAVVMYLLTNVELIEEMDTQPA